MPEGTKQQMVNNITRITRRQINLTRVCDAAAAWKTEVKKRLFLVAMRNLFVSICFHHFYPFEFWQGDIGTREKW